MKKITIFISSFQTGGVERVMITLANNLALQSYEVSLVVSQEKGIFKELVNPEIKIVNLNAPKLRYAISSLTSFLRKTNPDILLCGPDFVNVISIIATKLARWKGKLFISQHSYHNIENRRLGIHGAMFPYIAKILYPLSTKIVAVSEGVRQMLIEWGISPEKIVKILNPIEIESVQEMALCDENESLPENYIVFIGRLEYVKNIPLLFQAFQLFIQKNPSYHLMIAGEGGEEIALKQLAEKMNIYENVKFLGNLTNPFSLIAKAKLLVLPSFSECLPTVIIEAMALGITSVSTPTGGGMEISENGKYAYMAQGFDNKKEFSELISYACEHPIDPLELKRRAESFNISGILKQYVDLFQNV